MGATECYTASELYSITTPHDLRSCAFRSPRGSARRCSRIVGSTAKRERCTGQNHRVAAPLDGGPCGGRAPARRSARMTTRRLAVILAADVVGFSSMMEKHEEGTLQRVKALQREVIEPKVRERGGRLVK